MMAEHNVVFRQAQVTGGVRKIGSKSHRVCCRISVLIFLFLVTFTLLESAHDVTVIVVGNAA